MIQWKNSKEVTSWFNNIAEKKKQCFINFDIVEYYPSIRKDHVVDALKFAENYANISTEDRDIILNACKTIMLHDGRIWRKKERSRQPLRRAHGVVPWGQDM